MAWVHLVSMEVKHLVTCRSPSWLWLSSSSPWSIHSEGVRSEQSRDGRSSSLGLLSIQSTLCASSLPCTVIVAPPLEAWKGQLPRQTECSMDGAYDGDRRRVREWNSPSLSTFGLMQYTNRPPPSPIKPLIWFSGVTWLSVLAPSISHYKALVALCCVK